RRARAGWSRPLPPSRRRNRRRHRLPPPRPRLIPLREFPRRRPPLLRPRRLLRPRSLRRLPPRRSPRPSPRRRLLLRHRRRHRGAPAAPRIRSEADLELGNGGVGGGVRIHGSLAVQRVTQVAELVEELESRVAPEGVA